MESILTFEQQSFVKDAESANSRVKFDLEKIHESLDQLRGWIDNLNCDASCAFDLATKMKTLGFRESQYVDLAESCLFEFGSGAEYNNDLYCLHDIEKDINKIEIQSRRSFSVFEDSINAYATEFGSDIH